MRPHWRGGGGSSGGGVGIVMGIYTVGKMGKLSTMELFDYSLKPKNSLLVFPTLPFFAFLTEVFEQIHISNMHHRF